MEETIIKDEFDNYSRGQLIDEIKHLRTQLDINRGHFMNLENRLIGANNEIDFLRQVIINLTKK